jgi:hypothetical protein
VKTPPVHTWGDGYNDKIVHEYPSAGPVFTLQPDVNKLSFTGAQFGTKDQPALGIDFDLVTVSDEAQQAHIGNWADNWVGGLYNTFLQVNGRAYEDSIASSSRTRRFYFCEPPSSSIASGLQVRLEAFRPCVFRPAVRFVHPNH